MSRNRRLALGIAVILLPLGALALSSMTTRRAENSAPFPADPVTQLVSRIESTPPAWAFEDERGYLKALLAELKVPLSSQMLVHSRTSLQEHLISPKTPRAIYFNDDVYIAWVPEGLVEIMSIDPEQGPIFYTMGHLKGNGPRLLPHTNNCFRCHSAQPSKLFTLSVLTDSLGNSYGSRPAMADWGPFTGFWGGWYVTGTHGEQRHMGNLTPMPANFTGNIEDYMLRSSSSHAGNVTDLSARFDTSRYLSAHSDIVALLVHKHQIDTHNIMIGASFKVRENPALTEQVGEAVVEELLFANTRAFTAPVVGTSSFTADFPSAGPRDSFGRSLRDFDLQTRLFKYPLSYLVYTESFDRMPDVLRDYVQRRLMEVLRGHDTKKAFAHLSESDRHAILGILRETKPDLYNF